SASAAPDLVFQFGKGAFLIFNLFDFLFDFFRDNPKFPRRSSRISVSAGGFRRAGSPRNGSARDRIPFHPAGRAAGA
ncbi:hypothetical protein CEJ87_18380, partial [Caldifermentibacillus hisashii]